MFLVTSCRIVYRAALKWSEHGGSRLGAALAYYALFSIAPLLLIGLQVAGEVFGRHEAKAKVHEQLDAVMGREIAPVVEKMVENAADSTDRNWTPVVSVVLLIVGALGAFLHVRGALCMIWQLEPPRGSTWLGILWDYVLAVAMVFTVAILLLFSVACGLVIPIVRKTMPDYFQNEHYWEWLELGLSFVFLTLLFAASYWILSGGRIGWGYVLYGSILASVLFTIGKTVLGYYIVYSGTASMYGAAGSVVVFLMWVYYSAQVLFFGAELIEARRTRQEWMNGERSPAGRGLG